ncbi:MAG TPA: O-antigen ligase family protein [Capsulimonadaceae bacterium]
MIITALILFFVLLTAPLQAAIPDEALWSPILVGVVLLAAAAQGVSVLRGRSTAMVPRTVTRRLGVAIFSALLSLLWQWAGVHHGAPVFLDVMLRGFALLLAGFALMTSFTGVLIKRRAAYLALAGLLLGATISSYIGLQDYLVHVMAHVPEWREFATSTPDYFAAFLVMTIPVTLALFLSEPKQGGMIGTLAFGMALLPQIFVLPTTGSRFALISMAAGIVVMAVAAFTAKRSGWKPTRYTRVRVMALVVVALLGGVVVAKPILHRLSASVSADQAHSGQFRIWTWRGALNLAQANPVLGTGPGTFMYSYQKHALVGFTRMAHNSYLQAADEIGLPGLLLLVAGFGGTVAVGWRSLKHPEIADEPETTPAPEPPAKLKQSRKRQQPVVAPQAEPAGDMFGLFIGESDKLLQCGLLGGFAGGLIQNLIDSDWYVTFNGLTLWFIGGLIVALAVRSRAADAPTVALPRPLLVAYTAVAGIVGVVMLTWGAAEANATAGKAIMASGGDPASAQAAYRTAASLNPLRADYASVLGYRINPALDPAQAEADLKRAVMLVPDAVNYRRLGRMYASQGRPGDVLAVATDGLKNEPNNVDLWNLSAEAHLALGDIAGATADYRKLATIETSLIGTIRAVTETVDINYVNADLYLADHGSVTEKLELYGRVESTLRAFAEEGGTANQMRMSQLGGRRDLELDAKLRDQYDHASTGLIEALKSSRPANVAAVEARRTTTLAAFDNILKPTTSR